jgi:hypothetical protein
MAYRGSAFRPFDTGGGSSASPQEEACTNSLPASWNSALQKPRLAKASFLANCREIVT